MKRISGYKAPLSPHLSQPGMVTIKWNIHIFKKEKRNFHFLNSLHNDFIIKALDNN